MKIIRIVLLFMIIVSMTAFCNGKNKKGEEEIGEEYSTLINDEILEGESTNKNVRLSSEVTEPIGESEQVQTQKKEKKADSSKDENELSQETIDQIASEKNEQKPIPKEEVLTTVPEVQKTVFVTQVVMVYTQINVQPDDADTGEKSVRIEKRIENREDEDRIRDERMDQKRTTEPKPEVNTIKPRSDRPQKTHVGYSILNVGENDESGQWVDARKYVKMTALAISSEMMGKYVDFEIYALPVNRNYRFGNDYLIAFAKNIDIINGQAQLTKYWNGMNYYKNFMKKGDYELYFVYRFKDPDKNVLKTEKRYWGGSSRYRITVR